MRSARAWCVFLLALLVLGACGTDDNACEDVSCGEHGSCDPETGACVCETGYHLDGDVCLEDECSADADCDDGLACNGQESCAGGACRDGQAVSCPDHAACTEPDGDCVCETGYHLDGDVCLEDECSADADCDDGLACNGQESCAGGECQDGRMIVCPEHAACTEPAGDCVCDPGYEQVGDACVAELPIAGLWHDLYGTDHEVSQASWSQTTAGSPETDSLFHIHRVEAEARFLVAQNDADNPWNPELWSRFDWTWHQGALYYCQIAYDAASEEAAAAAAGADPSDPEHGGCGAFAWSRLNPTLEIIGDYTDNYGGGHEISQLVWFQFTDGYPEYDSFFHISFVDSEAQSLVAQNDADNGFNPELWSRFDWTFVDGVLWYCQTIYDAASEAAARAASPADPSDPASGGCGGYAWSRLDPI